ncbi:MAG: DUF6851 domain-containing protein, partial [Candidatus Promineifilaceae bacterium]
MSKAKSLYGAAFAWKRWLVGGLSLAFVLVILVWSPAASQNGQIANRCAESHLVQRGDTLYSLARRYGVDVRQLAALNNLRNPNYIIAGTRLCIRTTVSSEAVVTNRPAQENGVTRTANNSVPVMPENAQPHASYHPSPVVLWNEVMLAAVRNGPPRPTVIARSLYLVHQAMYDAWSAYDATAQPVYLDPALRRPPAEHTEANKAAAVSQAAYQMLSVLFPDYEKNSNAFSTLIAMQGYPALTEGDDSSTPHGIGYLAAASVLAGRESDGSNMAGNYADIISETYPTLYQPVNSADPTSGRSVGGADYDPNHWQPLRVPTGILTDEYGQPMADAAIPESFNDQVYVTPHWGAVVPFALLSGDQFRPSAPPQRGSNEPYTDAAGSEMSNDEAFRQQVEEIRRISAELTDQQKVTAEYWADGPRSETPPGHWNSLAHGISERDMLGIDEDVKLYLALDGALFDASIAAWDAKRAYDFVRPATAIQDLYFGQEIEAWGGPNRGTQLIPAAEWRPYQSSTFVTPAFAEYVSGHSVFSATAAEVLTRFTGSNVFYDGKTILYYEDYNRDGVPDVLGQHLTRVGGNMFEGSPAEVVVLQWPTFQDAADEAGLSRRYGGIHFQDGDLRGRAMGTQIGAQA